LKHPFVTKTAPKKDWEKEDLDSLSKVILILRDYSGIDFAYYKENTINRRLERRISVNRFASIEKYLEFLAESDAEKEILYREFLIGVTHFFRDKEAFDSLYEKVFPKLFSTDKKLFRVWTTGCSTGEEAFSITILLMEAAEKFQYSGEIKVFASDIDRNSIEKASRGLYPESIVSDVEAHLLKKYFHKADNGYQINENVRNNIVFATHNVLKDPPFSKLDLLVCRNLFIYLKPEIQSNLLSRFYYSLNPGGYLFMGSSETLGGMSEAFEIIDTKNKIYKYKKGFTPPVIDNLTVDITAKRFVPEGIYKRKGKNGGKVEKILESLVVDFVPPSIIIDSNFLIINIINDVNPFTEIQPGEYPNELFSILPKNLGLFVNNLLRQLKNSNDNSMSRIVTGLDKSDKKTIRITGRKIHQGDLTYYVISFEFIDFIKPELNNENYKNIDLATEQTNRVADLEQELKDTKENLAATVEELESANEELQSSNEELIASNEELQSTNEELQSVNEELYTVNSEHQEKIEELTRLNNDINNLLKNTEVAAIYLDGKLCIRKITPHVSKISNIIDKDLGRPIAHITAMDGYPEIAEDAQKVLDTLQKVDREFQDASGNSFFARLRPYRTENNSVDGILISIFDATELKKLEAKNLVATERLTTSLKHGKMAWWEWDITTERVTCDERKATMLGYKPDEFPDNVYEICKLIHPDDYDATMNEMRKVLTGDKSKWDATYRMKRKNGSYAWYQDHGSVKMFSDDGKPEVMMGVVVDISEYQDLSIDYNKNEELLSLIMKSSPVSTVMVDAEGQLTYANKKAEDIFNVTQEQILKRTYDASEWEITGEDGKKMNSEELPFSIISKTKKPLNNFRHYIQVPGNKKVLLSIDGAPVISDKNKFEGAVFVIKKLTK
jgi:two-component system CheB/CheR fusion protein